MIKKYISNEFKFWLIGFTEGDGSFYSNKKTGYLEFKITQTDLDKEVLKYIKKNLNFGSITVNDRINKTNDLKLQIKKVYIN